MKRAALFVGVNRYDDPEINPLQFAESDATELYAFFKHRAGYDDVRHLLSPDSDELLDTAHQMSASLAPDDLFLFFFAGHGVEHEGRHLLLCPKARYGRLKYLQHAVPLDLLKQETAKGGLHRVLILDACRTDLLKGHRGASAGLRDVQCLRQVVSPDESGAGSLAILCSCDEGQQAREIPQCRQGLFSMALLKVMQDNLAQSDDLTFSDVLTESLTHEMTTLSGTYGFSMAQRPWIQKSGTMPSLFISKNSGREIVSRKTLVPPHSGRAKHVETVSVNKAPAPNNTSRIGEVPREILEFRSRVFEHRLQRLLPLARKARISWERMERQIDKETLCSIIKKSKVALLHSPEWFRCINLVTDRTVQLNLLPEQAAEQFSKMDATREIQNGPHKYSADMLENKTSFFLRAANIYSAIFESPDKTREALNRARQSIDSAYGYIETAVAFNDLIGARNDAVNLWHDARKQASTTSELTSLVSGGLELQDVLADNGVEILTKAERLAEGTNDCLDVAIGYFDFLGDVENAKRVTSKGMKQFDVEEWPHDLPGIVERFADAGDLRFTSETLDQAELNGFPVILPALHGKDIALLWSDALGDSSRAILTLRKLRDFIEKNNSYKKMNKGSELFDWAKIGAAYILLGRKEEGRSILREQAAQCKSSNTLRKSFVKTLTDCGEDPDDYI